jgi:hypothetical protein
MLAAASLVEINSDLYTRNLLEYFHDDTDVTNWLMQDWQHEEIQHWAALRLYVNTVCGPIFPGTAAFCVFYGTK